MFYFSNSSLNLISLALLNNNKIFNDNENETLYNVYTKKILAQAKKWNNNFFFQFLNFSNAAINFVKRLDKIYQLPTFIYQIMLRSAKQILLI